MPVASSHLHRIRVAAVFCALVISFFGFFGMSRAAEAASLYFSPGSGTYNVGQDFSVSVYVSSADQAMNAAQGVIDFPADRLQVTSLSKAGSIMTLWVQEPAFSNGNGTINFEGIVLNPGFKGAAGKIITINFKVKAAGSGTLSFTSGSVLANDGEGTNILSGLSSANFSLVASVPAETPPTPQVVGVPGVPTITSASHPDSQKWFINNDPKFEWVLPRGVTGVNVLADREPSTDPGTTSDGVLSSYSYTNVDDGVWYFHLRFKNDQGWGKVGHFKFQIDTVKPSFIHLTELKNEGINAVGTRFQIDAEDATSGIDFYEVKIDNLTSVIWRDDGTHIYDVPPLDQGKHEILVKAFDKAGNYILANATFTSEGLLPPRIVKYPVSVSLGAPVGVQGMSYAKSTVNVSFVHEGSPVREKIVETDENGQFTVIFTDVLEAGKYHISATVTDASLHTSQPSDTVVVSVEAPSWFRIGSGAANLLLLIIPSLFVLIVLILLLLHIYRKLRDIRKHIRREIRDVEDSVHEAFRMLQTDMKKHIKLLETARNKRELTREEEKIVEQMKHDMEIAEKLVNKEIEQMKREVE